MTSRKTLYTLYIIVGGLAVLVVLGLALSSRHNDHPASVTNVLDSQQKALASSPYSDPILKYLPYGDIGYRITPVIGTVNNKQALTITIDITFSGADYGSSPAEQQRLIDQREASALNYLVSKDFDPHNYRIVFNTPSP